jgi:hypothetical protein
VASGGASTPMERTKGLIAFFHIGFRVICVIFQRYAEFHFFHGPGCKMYLPTMCFFFEQVEVQKDPDAASYINGG